MDTPPADHEVMRTRHQAQRRGPGSSWWTRSSKPLPDRQGQRADGNQGQLGVPRPLSHL